MEMFQCSKCGNEVTGELAFCPNCGSQINNKKNAGCKRKIFVGVFVIVIIALVFIVVQYTKSPATIATRLVKEDFGNNIVIENIYYNSEENGCIVIFSVNGVEDIASVHLDEKTVGYESVYDKLSEKMNNATTDEETQQYAIEVVNYDYDPLWIFNLHANGTKAFDTESNWETLK